VCDEIIDDTKQQLEVKKEKTRLSLFLAHADNVMIKL